MKTASAFLRHFRPNSLFTAVAVVALAQSAFADEGPLGRPARAVEAVLTVADLPAAASAEKPLPRRIGTEIDESDLREAHEISINLFPQGRMSSKEPFIDWSKWELGAFAGAVMFSSDFEAPLSYVLGVTTRVPVPGLGGFGFYGEAFISYVNRDLPFYYNSQAGSWYGVGVGVDYTPWRGSLGYVRPQVGVMYAYWNGVNSLDNGIGITIGVQVGLFWIKNNDKTSVTFNPQFQMQSSDYMIFLPIGFSIDF